MPKIWQLQEAKARFSELVDRALEGEAQVVTRHGQKVVVVLEYEKYTALTGDNLNAWDALREHAPMLEDEWVDTLFKRDKSTASEVYFDLDT